MAPPMSRYFNLLPPLALMIWNELLALLWPCACLVCGAANRQLCSDCLATIRGVERQARWVQVPSGVTVCVAAPYSGPLRALILGYKHGGLTRFSSVLARVLSAPLEAAVARSTRGQAVRSASVGKTTRQAAIMLVTVPSRPAQIRKRGYRHVDLLVRRTLRNRASALTRSNVCLAAGALRTRSGRTSQVGLTHTERMRNATLVRVPRRARRRLNGKEVVLVDDIVTTGATVRAASQALEAAGARVLGIAALCAVVRIHHRGRA